MLCIPPPARPAAPNRIERLFDQQVSTQLAATAKKKKKTKKKTKVIDVLLACAAKDCWCIQSTSEEVRQEGEQEEEEETQEELDLSVVTDSQWHRGGGLPSIRHRPIGQYQPCLLYHWPQGKHVNIH